MYYSTKIMTSVFPDRAKIVALVIAGFKSRHFHVDASVKGEVFLLVAKVLSLTPPDFFNRDTLREHCSSHLGMAFSFVLATGSLTTPAPSLTTPARPLTTPKRPLTTPKRPLKHQHNL
jgi:hypothetical protein